MLISRAPFRVSFAGGGSDLADFYLNSIGEVLSTSINKYMYIMIHPYFHDKIRIKYSRTEDVCGVEEIQHPIVRECLKKVGIASGIEIASIADIPAGTGLGSSSAFTVALLNALYAFTGQALSKARLAAMACEIEIEILKEPIGKQDQYASTFGGLNILTFNSDQSVNVKPIVLKREILAELGQKLLLFYFGNTRKASAILEEQKANMSDLSKREILTQMVSYVADLMKALSEGDLDQFGSVLHASWLLKQKLASGITNPQVNDIYEVALKAGALGGKLLGAGGGGFLLLYCPPDKQESVREKLQLRELKFSFEREGAKIIYLD